MGTIEIIKRAWENIDYFRGGALQLDIEHPLEWHVGYETPSNKALIIISNIAINNVESSRSINETCNKRKDGRYYISFQLTDSTQEEVFIYMCSDLINYSLHANTEREAINRVESRFSQWRRLMEKRHSEILSGSKRKGLIGELLYLKHQIEKGLSNTVAIKGWVGPDGADQDFVYDQLWREIKTTTQSSDEVSIHSLEQLGKEDEYGKLIVYRVDSCAPEAENAFTLRSLVKHIYTLLNDDYAAIELFTIKLNNAGYIDLEVYDSFPYKLYGTEVYDVNEEFPRIVRSNVRSEIIECSYSISLSAIANWKEI